jgi:hypothetical protein
VVAPQTLDYTRRVPATYISNTSVYWRVYFKFNLPQYIDDFDQSESRNQSGRRRIRLRCATPAGHRGVP